MVAQSTCPHCTDHSLKHGSTASEPGQKILVTQHHKHGKRKCDECGRPFRSQFHSVTFDHPESPAEPFSVGLGRKALVHKGCKVRYLARLERERENGGTGS